jgi:hypothetical protein
MDSYLEILPHSSPAFHCSDVHYSEQESVSAGGLHEPSDKLGHGNHLPSCAKWEYSKNKHIVLGVSSGYM